MFLQQLINLFEEKNNKKVLEKGNFLIQEGQIETNIYYIKKGAVRVFHLTDAEEQTIRFGYDGSIINSLSSFIQESPSEFYLDAVRKSTVLVLSKNDLTELVNVTVENTKAYNTFLEVVITQQIERELDLLTISPSQRLERVLKRSPNLFQQVPLKYIASYLRMTPETLSRVRKS